MALSPKGSKGMGRTAFTAPAPIKVAQSWLSEISPNDDFPLIDVSQAAPSERPHPDLLAHMADVLVTSPSVNRYGAILGLNTLRLSLAGRWSSEYHTPYLDKNNIAITSGCNQAFCAVISAIAQKGDNVILPSPWYFNHNMWLEMSEVDTRALPCGDNMIPDPALADTLIDDATKAICLVTPNNPTGVEYPLETLAAFYDLAKRHGIKLILDETYKDFRSYNGPPHTLLQNPDWSETVIQLYSFSKSYRLMGHRVGAIFADANLLGEVEKFLDTVTICPTPLGQEAALFGINMLGDWLEEERQKVLKKQEYLKILFKPLEDQGWKILGCGAFFAYVSYPFDIPAMDIAKNLLKDKHLLTLPSDMFLPVEQAGKQRCLRLAFANIDQDGLQKMVERLTNLPYCLAPVEKGA